MNVKINSNIKPNNVLYNNVSINKNSKSNQKQNKPLLNKGNTFTKSQIGRINEMIQSLIEQKQKVTDNKNNLISKTLEEGKDIKSIKEQVKLYDEQVKEINEQITDLKFQKKQISYMNLKKKNPANKKNKAKKSNSSKVSSVMGKHSQFATNKTIMSLMKKAEGKQRILRKEKELDMSRGMSTESVERDLGDVKDTISHLNKILSGKVSYINTSFML